MTDSGLWTPSPITPPLRDKFTIQELCEYIQGDILVADRLFMSQSYPLVPYQRVSLKALHDHKFIFLEASRGGAKSWLMARGILDLCLMYKLQAIFTGPTYRQALIPFNYVLDFLKENSGPNLPLSLDREIDGQPVNGTMEARVRFKNGSVIKALPMADGSKLRGHRADILFNDEAFKLEKTMYKQHIVPFLQKPIIEGRPEVKLILSTSAETQDCYAYSLLINEWLKNIKEGSKKHVVLDWNVSDIQASGLKLDDDIINLTLQGADEEERQRVLYNRWIGLSGQFMPGNLVERLSSPVANIEHEAQEGFTYGLTVDVATAKNGDQFIIHTWKHLGHRKTVLVNSYWASGMSNDDMAWYIHQFHDKFNPEWIIMDPGGGGLFVQSSLSKRKLVLSDGTEKTVQVPILLHDEPILDGHKKLIFVKPTDPYIRVAFSGDRSRGGEEIKTYDVLVHMMYDGLRQAVISTDCPFMIPAYASEEGDDYDRSEVKILDLIRESLYQLRYLTKKMQEDSSGVKTVVLSKNGKVPMYVWKNAAKDGAVAFAYGYILHALHYRDERGIEKTVGEPIIQEDNYGDLPWWQFKEDPRQIYNPFQQNKET